MLVLRCTRKLLDRLHAVPAPDNAASTTVLGDWYATILPIRPAHLILLVNERSRLPVVLPARQLSTVLDRIPEAVAGVLLDLGIDPQAVARETAAMGTIRCDTTRSRNVLGTMNEFVFHIQIGREGRALPDPRVLSLNLARDLVTIRPLGYRVPAKNTGRLLADEALHSQIGPGCEVSRRSPHLG